MIIYTTVQVGGRDRVWLELHVGLVLAIEGRLIVKDRANIKYYGQKIEMLPQMHKKNC